MKIEGEEDGGLSHGELQSLKVREVRGASKGKKIRERKKGARRRLSSLKADKESSSWRRGKEF